MSLQLSSGEKVIKSFDYASVGVLGIGQNSNTTKTLTVTNKRVVHQTVSTGLGKDCVKTNEIPLEYAKYVDSYYGMKSYSALLFLGIVFALVAIISLIALSDSGAGAFVAFLILGIVAAGCILLYVFKKDYLVTFTIKTDSRIVSALGGSSRAGSSATAGIFSFLRSADSSTTINVRVKVNKEVGKALAEELGKVLLEAKEGTYNSENI